MIDIARPPLRVNRREFALGSVGALAAAGLFPLAAAGQDAQPAPPLWETHLKAILGDRQPVADKVTLDLPEIVENGNLVPFTVAVDYQATEADYIQALHVIGTANPAPQIASFYFTPLTGIARASSRMRLLDTQEVIAVAQTSGGEFFIGRRRVEVIVGCCGG